MRRRRASAARARASSRSAAASSANRSRSLRLRVSTRSCRPRLGVDEPEVADVRAAPARAGRGSRPRATSCARGQLEQRAAASRAGPRKSETTTTTERRRASLPSARERRRRATSARPARGPARAAARRAAPSRPRPPCRGGRGRRVAGRRTWRRASRLPRRTAKWPTASATPSATSHLRRSAVPKVIDAEVSSSSHVSTRPLGDVHAHVRLAGARGDVPVDQPDVVAEHVRPHLRELGAVAERPRSGGRRRAARRSGGGRSGRPCAAAPPAAAPGPGRAGRPGRRGARGRRSCDVLAATRSSCGIATRLEDAVEDPRPRRRPRRAPRS